MPTNKSCIVLNKIVKKDFKKFTENSYCKADICPSSCRQLGCPHITLECLSSSFSFCSSLPWDAECDGSCACGWVPITQFGDARGIPDYWLW